MNLTTTEEQMFFKIFYTIRHNSVEIILDKDINNLHNHNIEDIQYDFMKIDLTKILSLCNVDTYNKLINLHYLNNENEYLMEYSYIRTLHRNKIDKLFILEGINNYRTIFQSIYVHDNVFSPKHQKLFEFAELEVITQFTNQIVSFLQDLEENMEVNINYQEIILNLSKETDIFKNMSTVVRKRLENDMSKHYYKKENDVSFMPSKRTGTPQDWETDIHTIEMYPKFYNFLQEMYPETTVQIQKMINSKIFKINESIVQFPYSKSIKNMRFTTMNNIQSFPDLVINNILINFYRNPKLKTFRIIVSISETMWQVMKKETPLELLYIYGFDINLEDKFTILPPNSLKHGVHPARENIKLIFKEDN